MFAIRKMNGDYFIGFGPSQGEVTKMVPQFNSNSMLLLKSKDLEESVRDVKKFFNIEIVTVEIIPIPKAD